MERRGRYIQLTTAWTVGARMAPFQGEKAYRTKM